MGHDDDNLYIFAHIQCPAVSFSFLIFWNVLKYCSNFILWYQLCLASVGNYWVMEVEDVNQDIENCSVVLWKILPRTQHTLSFMCCGQYDAELWFFLTNLLLQHLQHPHFSPDALLYLKD